MLAVLAVVSLLAIVVGVYRVYFSPLSKFPGSKLAAVSLWYEFYWDIVHHGMYMWKIEEWHKLYGPIVRINPHELHIIDPEFYDELYSAANKPDKYTWWTNLAGANESGFSTGPHHLHRMRRAAMSPFFSAQSVAKLEPMIKAKVQKLCNRLDTFAQTDEIFRLDVACMALTMDIICDYAFAADRHYLDEPDFNLQWKQTVVEAFGGAAFMRMFPWLLPLMKRLPPSVVAIPKPSLAYLLAWQNLVRKQVEPILKRIDDISKTGDSSRTIFHTLRDSNLPDEEKTLQRLCDEGEILTGAGSETSAMALARILFYLKLVPEALRSLREELDRAAGGPDGSQNLTWAELQQLPYLTSVIREGLRLSYGVTTRMPRILHEDLEYKGWVIPAGVPVSQTTYFILMHPSVFPEPDRFRPERWIEAQEEGQRLDRYLVCFGKGSRACLGINLAHAELYLALAAIVCTYDWEMYETGLDDIICKRDSFVSAGDPNSKGVRARFMKRRDW